MDKRKITKIFMRVLSVLILFVLLAWEMYAYLNHNDLIMEFSLKDIFFKGGTLDDFRVWDFRLTAIYSFQLLHGIFSLREDKYIEELNAVGALFPLVTIGSEVYAVGELDGEPYMEKYTITAIKWDGGDWYAEDGFNGAEEFKVGTDLCILDRDRALRRFREIEIECLRREKENEQSKHKV